MLLKNLVSYFRTHTFSNIILSFVAILTLALTLLGIFSYNAYRGALMENAVNGSRTKMELIQEQIDAEVQSLHYAMLSILSNSTLSNFENYTKSASATDASRVSTRCSSASGCSARISSRTSAAAS